MLIRRNTKEQWRGGWLCAGIVFCLLESRSPRAFISSSVGISVGQTDSLKSAQQIRGKLRGNVYAVYVSFRLHLFDIEKHKHQHVSSRIDGKLLPHFRLYDAYSGKIV